MEEFLKIARYILKQRVFNVQYKLKPCKQDHGHGFVFDSGEKFFNHGTQFCTA